MNKHSSLFNLFFYFFILSIINGWFFKVRDDMKYEEKEKYETEKVVSIR